MKIQQIFTIKTCCLAIAITGYTKTRNRFGFQFIKVWQHFCELVLLNFQDNQADKHKNVELRLGEDYEQSKSGYE